MSESNVTVITTTADLAAFCDIAAKSRYISIDTEFIREKTYYPILCLVQIACEKQAATIDPLAEGIDLAPLFDLLQNKDVLKVFHAARQDVEIFYYLSGSIPFPMYDTQVAAMVCGFGESISYDGLVREITREQLDKTSRFTNWEQRPLTKKQLEYALADVTHLRPVFEYLEKRIHESG
ncbi:MAG: ribonuclease D, partial [Alphaproteobacteria bacterium]|nr:ribonuclease D [Alphaproteobacteria bacterium]